MGLCQRVYGMMNAWGMLGFVASSMRGRSPNSSPFHLCVCFPFKTNEKASFSGPTPMDEEPWTPTGALSLSELSKT